MSEGYAAVGYEYINVDDCWLAKTRDASGRLQADPERFPSGMKALGSYVSQAKPLAQVFFLETMWSLTSEFLSTPYH